MKKLLHFFLIITCYFCCLSTSRADHAAGGEITYECLGNDQYRIRFVFFRDCRGIPLNTSFNLEVYDINENRVQRPSLPLVNSTTLLGVAPTPCTIIPDNVCLEVGTYEAIVTLPPIAGGYTIMTGTCCRNGPIINGPERDVAYYATIPDASVVSCNSNATFTQAPPVYICLNDSLNLDFSATDIDGDSLSYELCTPFESPSAFPKVPYSFRGGYSATNPLGGSNPLTIDPVTGQLSGVPPTAGKFVVGICVNEYRNGRLIANTTRDLQLNVVQCQPVTFSQAISAVTNCRTKEVTFFNTSSGASSYLWDFGDGSATSTDEDPVHVYPSYGTFTATLIGYNAGTPACNDTNTVIVQVDTCRPCGMSGVVSTVDGICDAIEGCAEITWEQPCAGGNYTFAYGGTSLSGNCSSTGGSSSGSGAAPFYTSISGTVDGIAIPDANTIETVTLTGPSGSCTSFVGTSTNSANGNIIFRFNAEYTQQQTGQASVAITGGTPPYNIQWTTSPVQTGDTIRKVDPGSYDVIITDANGCIEIIPFVVSGTSNMTLATSSTDITTCGANDGTANVVVSNGGGTIRYLWTPGGFTTASISNLSPGTYSVLVSDDTCSKSATVTINDVANVVVAINKSDITCPDQTNGSATVTSTSGGVAPYTYAWNTSPVQTGTTATGLSFGFYTVVATDQNGCTGEQSFSITGPVRTSTSISKTDNTCAGSNDGMATVAISNGTAPYGISWSTSPPQSSSTAMGLEGGFLYYVTVTDDNNCETVDSVFIDEPPHMHIDLFDLSTVDCAGNFDGSIQAAISGGNPNLENKTIIYSEQFATDGLDSDCPNWVTDVRSAGAGNILNASSYFRTINNQFAGTRLNGEGVWRSQVIDISADPTVTISGDFFECGNMEATDYVRAFYSINGGPEIQWFDLTDDGAIDCTVNNAIQAGLAGNTIQIIVRMNNGNSEIHRFDNINVNGAVSGVLYDEPFNTNDLWNDLDCAWTRDVSAIVNTSINGTGNNDHVETRNGAMEFQDIDGEVVWQARTVDIAGCNTIQLSADFEYTGLALSGDYIRAYYRLDGGAEVLWGDHTGSSAAAWPGGTTASDTIGGLSGTTLDIVVRVNNSFSNTIHKFDNVQVYCTQSNEIPYDLAWTCSTSTSDSIGGLPEGVCTLSVTDSIGCMENSSINLVSPGAMTATVVSTASCGSSNTGTATASPVGGNPPYNYNWGCSPSSQQAINNLAGGTNCTVTITDNAGCVQMPSFSVNTVPDFSLDTIVDPGSCNSDGSIDLIVMGGTAAFDYAWNTGETTEDIMNLPTNSYYRVAVRDANQCLKTLDLFLDSTCRILPVTDLLLQGESAGKKNRLYWTTQLELNNDYFWLQHSPDGILWQNISQINGAGTSTQVNHYQDWDSYPYSTTYYRLQQVNFDGSFNYSNTIVLSNKSIREVDNIELYPNPTQDYFIVTTPYATAPTVRIFDAIGQELQLPYQTVGQQQLQFDTSELAAAVYWVQIRTANVLTSKKLVVHRP